jgi:GT2 family glycosyltransferase
MLERLFRAVKPKSLPGKKAGSPQAPLVSVVLGSYNRCELLKHAIESARENAAFVRYEIIVIDGGSTDGSLEWLQAQKDTITIIQHNRGEFNGKALARRSWGYFMNLGFKIAQGKFILMISDDCILLPGSIEHGVQVFEDSLAKRKLVGGVAFYFRNWPEEKQYYVQRTLGGRLMVNHGLFLREALEQVNWIDEDAYMFYKADGDLCLRLWDAGYEIIDAPGAFVEHFLDAEETVRLSNNQTLEMDKKTYATRWKALLLTAGNDQMGKVTNPFEDPARTAEIKFGSLIQ